MCVLYTCILLFRPVSTIGYYKTLHVAPEGSCVIMRTLYSKRNLRQAGLAAFPRLQLVEHPGFFFRSDSLSPYTTWLSTISDTDALLAEWGKGGVVTVDMGGRVRLWETGLEHLQRSLMEWRNMIGEEGDRHMQVPLDLTLPLKGAH